jgi:hypothetical protein
VKSRQQLVNRALEELGVVGAGQPASAEDYAVVNAAIESVMSDLATRDIWQWGNPDEYDEDAFEHLAVLLANAKARPFGKAPDEQVRLLAERRLRQLRPYDLSGQAQTTDYF